MAKVDDSYFVDGPTRSTAQGVGGLKSPKPTLKTILEATLEKTTSSPPSPSWGGFQSNQDQIMGPLMTISIDKDIISLIAPVPSSHCQSCWGGGGDSLAEDHLTP